MMDFIPDAQTLFTVVASVFPGSPTEQSDQWSQTLSKLNAPYGIAQTLQLLKARPSFWGAKKQELKLRRAFY